MAELTATSSNYLTVAALDDDHTAQAQPDRAEARRQRIEAAVERSRHEYRPEHAYTERTAGTRSSIGGLKPKVDRQHLEHLVSSLYCDAEYSAALQLVLDALDPSKKSMGGLSRELIDTGIRSALKSDDAQTAVTLACLTRDQWKSQFAGLATTSADAFTAAGLFHDALQPLLISAAAFGLHEPVLTRLGYVVTKINSGGLDGLLTVINAVKAKPKYSLQRSLFGHDSAVAITPTLDASLVLQRDAIVEALGFDSAALQGTLRRLEKAVGGSDEQEHIERGVRQL